MKIILIGAIKINCLTNDAGFDWINIDDTIDTTYFTVNTTKVTIKGQNLGTNRYTLGVRFLNSLIN